MGHRGFCTICTLLSQFFSKFYNFFALILEATSYYPRGLIMRRGNSSNSRNGLVRGVCVPGAFKLDHLHPVKPILFSKFYNFSSFIQEATSYYRRGLIMREGNSSNARNGLDRGVCVPWAFKPDHLQPVKQILLPKFYHFFTFILEANSHHPKGLVMRKGNSSNSRNGLDRGVCVPGAFKLDHLHPLKPILFSKFFNFFTLILEANS